MPALFAASSVHQALQHFLVVREASLRSWGDTCPQFTETHVLRQWPNCSTSKWLQRNWVAPTSLGRRSSLGCMPNWGGKRVGEKPIKIPTTTRDPHVVALTRCSPQLPILIVSEKLSHSVPVTCNDGNPGISKNTSFVSRQPALQRFYIE